MISSPSLLPAATLPKYPVRTVVHMTSFTFRECAHCGEQHAVLADGRTAIHFTGAGDRCAGSERRQQNEGVTAQQARVIEAELRRALREVMRGRAS